MSAADPDHGPVERCLDALFDQLAGTGPTGRRALAEAEDHLRSAVAEGVAGGLTTGEVVESRVALGVLGVVALLALAVARRTSHLGGPTWTPPRAAVAIPTAVLFGLAGLALSTLSGMQLVFGDHSMVGANLSAGVVSLVAAAAATAVAGRFQRARPGVRG